MRVEVPAGVAQDGAGNDNLAAKPFIIRAQTKPQVSYEREGYTATEGGAAVTVKLSQAWEKPR